MLANTAPSTQRVFALHVRRQRPTSSTMRRPRPMRSPSRCLGPLSNTAKVTTLAGCMTSVGGRQTLQTAQKRGLTSGPGSSRDSSRRIGAVSLGLGALLAAGGLSFLPGQGSPFPEPKAVVTEAAETPTEVCSDKNSTEQEVEASRTSQQRVSADAGGGEEFMVRVGEMEAAGVPRAPPKARYSYVIIGAGTTANAAVEAILQMQPDADILLLNEDTPTSTESTPRIRAGVQESSFKVLRPDLVDSFNQWRRHATVRLDEFVTGGDRGDNGTMGNGLGRGQGIRYYPYQPGGLRIESERRCISLDDGIEVFYDKCLIANPGKPRKFYAALDSGRVAQDGVDDPGGRGKAQGLLKESINKLLCLDDFASLEYLVDDPSVKHVTVIGGGFLGSEVALALASRGRKSGIKVSQVYAEKGPMQRLLPMYLARHMQRRLELAGVSPVGERLVTDFRCNPDTERVEVVLQGWAKRTLETDYIVLASTHIDPKVEVARESGLEIDQSNGGIVVNGLFEAVNGVYAAGNVASYFDPALGRRRIGSYDHSVNSGLCAGYNMAATLKATQNDHVLAEQDVQVSSGHHGAYRVVPSRLRRAPPGPHPRSYTHQPIWRSNLQDCDIVIEGVGEIDARLRTVGLWVDRAEDWDGEESDVVSYRERGPVYQRGIVYYLRGDKVAGVLLFNTSDLLERARELLRSQPKIKNMKQLKRQIPLAPDDWMRIEETPGSIHFRDEILTPPF